MKRREALQIGVGLFGLNLPAYLRAADTDRIRREIAALRQERADLDVLKNENSLLHRRPRSDTTTRTPTHAGGIA